MSMLQSGKVNLGFLGAAEVDRYGNLNSTQVVVQEKETGDGAGVEQGFSPANKMKKEDGALAPEAKKIVRLPGSGGACDIASLAHRFVAMIDHEKHRLPERVSYITSPGYGDGSIPGIDWRKRAGLPRGGPAAVITTKAVLQFDARGESYLATHHPGVSVDDIIASTGWLLRVGENNNGNVSETVPPTEQELRAIREYDKEGFWTS